MLPAVAVLLLAAPAAASPNTTRTFSAPFHGKFIHDLSRASGACPGSGNTTTYSRPTFDKATGIGHLNLQSNTSGTFCPTKESYSSIKEVFGFLTKPFALKHATHTITVSWSLRWLVQLIASGGTNGSRLPASASFSIGVNGTKLCATLTGYCLTFPNSSAAGSNASVGWSTSYTVVSSTHTAVGSMTVNLTLNATFGGKGSTYQIESDLYAMTRASSLHGAYHARAFLVFNPILGGYFKLVGITIT